MKLQQLRYVLAVVRHNLSISEAAEVLFTSQPGVSKQIRLLEDELGVQIFIRNGKRIVAITEPGRAVLRHAEQVMHHVHNIKKIGDDFALVNSGDLVIATSHTLARYVLPEIIVQFNKIFPKVKLIVKQGTPVEISNMVTDRQADFAIVTEGISDDGKELVLIPCGVWHYSMVVPKTHPLIARKDGVTLNDIMEYPLIGHEFALTAQSGIYRAFKKSGLMPALSFCATNSDVIKTLVRSGLGVGLLENLAFEASQDHDLCFIDTAHLFGVSAKQVLIRRDCYLRGFAYRFIELFAPELTRQKVEQVLYAPPEPCVVDDYVI